MPSNHNFVCFDCRLNARRSKDAEVAPRCPGCGLECTSVGYKIPVPAQADLAGWERLRTDVREAKRRALMRRDEERVARTHELERQLVRLESLATNPGRARAIRDLKKLLSELKQQRR